MSFSFYSLCVDKHTLILRKILTKTTTVVWNIIQMKMQSQQQQIGPAIIVHSLIVVSSAVAKFAICPGNLTSFYMYIFYSSWFIFSCSPLLFNFIYIFYFFFSCSLQELMPIRDASAVKMCFSSSTSSVQLHDSFPLNYYYKKKKLQRETYTHAYAKCSFFQ